MTNTDDALFAAILGAGDRHMTLAFGSPNEPMRELLRTTQHLPLAVQAGLWLYHDFFEESHAISQDLDTPDGSYWHGILHRREGDFSNAKYWYRKVGPHPVLASLALAAKDVVYHYTSPFDFVDFCQKVQGSNSAEEQLAVKVQMMEWKLLFEYCRGNSR